MDHQQAGSYMWTPSVTKRKLECYESWEERAFAEDAAGVLGSSGCVWPPRSYTCSFCRREFRSAQALGGHMNVHRRDRARLKQLPNTPQDQTLISPRNNGSLSASPFFKVDPVYKNSPSHNFSTYTSPNPNNSHCLFPTQEESNGVGKYKSSNGSFFVGHNKDIQGCTFSSPSSAKFHHHKHDCCFPNHHRNQGKREAKIIEVECRDHENEGNSKCGSSELSISLSLVVRRNRPEEEASCFKRTKIVATSSEASPPLILLSEGGQVDHKSKINIPSREVQALNNCSSTSREIDLELRLGG